MRSGDPVVVEDHTEPVGGIHTAVAVVEGSNPVVAAVVEADHRMVGSDILAVELGCKAG